MVRYSLGYMTVERIVLPLRCVIIRARLVTSRKAGGRLPDAGVIKFCNKHSSAARQRISEMPKLVNWGGLRSVRRIRGILPRNAKFRTRPRNELLSRPRARPCIFTHRIGNRGSAAARGPRFFDRSIVTRAPAVCRKKNPRHL